MQTDNESLVRWLDRASESGLVRELDEPELAYIFKHVLVQEASYSSLLRQERRELHARVARTLEALYPERRSELAGLLAQHYSEAGDEERAAHCFVEAADSAMRVFAVSEARAHYRRAIDLLEQLPPTTENLSVHVDTVLKYTDVTWHTANQEESLALLHAAEGLTHVLAGSTEEAAADRHRIARVHYQLGTAHIAMNQMPEAIRYFSMVLEEAHDLGDEDLLTIPAVSIGMVLCYQGRFVGARQLLERYVPRLEARQERWEWFTGMGALGICLAAMGEIDAGRALLLRAREVSEAASYLQAQTVSQLLLGWFYWIIGDDESALGPAREAGKLATQGGDRIYDPLALAQQAAALSRSGRHREGLESIRAAEKASAQIVGYVPLQDWVAAAGVEVRARAGETAEALAAAPEAIAIARAAASLYGEAMAHRAWAEAFVRQTEPDWKAALAELDEAERVFGEGGCEVEVANVRLLRGCRLVEAGREAEARANLEAAAACYDRWGLVRKLREARQMLERLDGGRGEES